MKELLFKFESEQDYEKFITEIVLPSLEKDKLEYDAQNNIIIVLKKE